MPPSSTDHDGKFRLAPNALAPLGIASVVSIVATLVSFGAPEEHAASGVGLVFLVSTYWLTLRRDAPRDAAEYGISFGGLLEPKPLSSSRMIRDSLVALGATLAAATLVFPAFALAFPLYHAGARDFSLARGVAGLAPVADFVLGQIFVVALPEEVFFRGYLQSELGARLGAPPSLRNGSTWLTIAATSALFALGHFATIPHPARLAVFFPSLVFGALRVLGRGVGASVLFHALSNVVSAFLFAAYGL